MTRPAFEWQISLGNIIQIGLLLVAGAIGWATFDARITANETAIRANGKTLQDHEGRMRAVEVSTTRTDERLTNILTLLARIDARLERIEETGK